MSTSFFPVGAGRASSALSLQRLTYQINTDQLAVLDLQTQLSTGRRIQRASQDPSASIRALAAQRQLEFKQQISTNLGSANAVLSATESALASAQAIITEMRGLAVEVTSNTQSDEERSAALAQIEAAYNRLVELGNTRFQDQYLFAGSNAASLPLVASQDSVRFDGRNDELLTISDTSSTVAANVTAEDAFGVKSDRVVGNVDLNPRLLPSTPLNTLNHGRGVAGGAIEISDGTNKIEIDLAGAYNLEDTINAINSKQLSGRTLRATLGTSGLQIDFADGLLGGLRISNVAAGTTASDLRIETGNTTQLVPIQGDDLDPLLRMNTPISSVFGGSGIAEGRTFTIRQGTRNYTISTNGLSTVEDLLNTIRKSGAKVDASIADGRYIAIQSLESGTTLSIAENGDTLATELGLRTMNVGTPLSQLNLGRGIETNPLTDDLVITRTDGTSFSVDLEGAVTVNDVLIRINNHVSNFTPTLRVVATLKPNGNGLVLTAPTGTQPISVSTTGGSQAAVSLGLIPAKSSTQTGTSVGTDSVIEGGDVSGVQVEGVFSTLSRMKNAVQSAQPEQMEAIAQLLDADLQRLSLARGLVGARQQSIASLQDSTELQTIALKEVESNELDADFASTISNLSGRQAALQASLQLMGQITQLSLFNYL